MNTNGHQCSEVVRRGKLAKAAATAESGTCQSSDPFRNPQSAIRISLCRFILFIIWFALGSARANEVVADPIADYLAMNVPDRAENAGRLLVLKRVEVDMEGNGKPVVFIGTWYRKSGPNTWLISRIFMSVQSLPCTEMAWSRLIVSNSTIRIAISPT
jgi:hypothetical protein